MNAEQNAIQEKYCEWLKNADDEQVKSELASVFDNFDEINDRFYCELEFGTGGLRGKLGAGTNRMNVYTVARATRGLAEYLCRKGGEASVAIAYDSRNMSKEFAFLAADVLSQRGVRVYIFSELMPTPVLSFAVRRLKTSAGIVITASHNPKEYNGYKVYNEKGCQITEQAAEDITKLIESQPYFSKTCGNRSIITVLDEKILNEFIADAKSYSLFSDCAKFAPKIVYTPLNGTGLKPVVSILKSIGIDNVAVVPEQAMPNGDFPTCPYPNPEEKAALSLAIKLAEKENADMVMATDPDADRIGIAVRLNSGEYRLFNGNETGAVMENYILSRKKANGSLPENPVVVKTIVTSDMASDIAAAYGAKTREVLTGFKYIGETIDALPNPENYVFGMEESYGYLVGRHVRDKDSVSAAMIIAEAACYYKSLGKSLADVLEELYAEYGYYKTALISKTYPGESGKKQMQDFISGLRKNPPEQICGVKITEVKDYSVGLNGLPKSNVLAFYGDGIKVIVRPSGTEPKIKFYLTAKRKTEQESDEILLKLREFYK